MITNWFTKPIGAEVLGDIVIKFIFIMKVKARLVLITWKIQALKWSDYGLQTIERYAHIRAILLLHFRLYL
jgi:hypothetical protein